MPEAEKKKRDVKCERKRPHKWSRQLSQQLLTFWQLNSLPPDAMMIIKRPELVTIGFANCNESNWSKRKRPEGGGIRNEISCLLARYSDLISRNLCVCAQIVYELLKEFYLLGEKKQGDYYKWLQELMFMLFVLFQASISPPKTKHRTWRIFLLLSIK